MSLAGWDRRRRSGCPSQHRPDLIGECSVVWSAPITVPMVGWSRYRPALGPASTPGPGLKPAPGDWQINPVARYLPSRTAKHPRVTTPAYPVAACGGADLDDPYRKARARRGQSPARPWHTACSCSPRHRGGAGDQVSRSVRAALSGSRFRGAGWMVVRIARPHSCSTLLNACWPLSPLWWVVGAPRIRAWSDLPRHPSLRKLWTRVDWAALGWQADSSREYGLRLLDQSHW